MNFAGKTAVVTGGSRGIGRAICEELARGGANVVLCYAGRAEAAQETVTACEDLGAKALAVQCNVADEAQVKALMDAAVKEFGRIDILVNNAGVTRDGLVMMMKEADFDAVPEADHAALIMILSPREYDAAFVGRHLEELVAVHPGGQHDAGDAPCVMRGREQGQIQRQRPGTDHAGERPLLAVQGVEAAFFEQHGQAFMQPHDEVDRRGEQPLPLEQVVAFAREVEIEAGDGDGFGAFPCAR